MEGKSSYNLRLAGQRYWKLRKALCRTYISTLQRPSGQSESQMLIMVDKQHENEHSQRRVFLRFKTADAPSDADIISAFYGYTGLRDADCYVHWQPREYTHTHIIVDIHSGSDKRITEPQNLPHEVYKIAWTTAGDMP